MNVNSLTVVDVHLKNKTKLHYITLCLLFSILISPIVSAQEKFGEGYAFEQNARLGSGVNIIGYDPLWKDPSQARMKEKHFKMISEAGFKNVRIKISPFKFSMNDSSFTIDPVFLSHLIGPSERH